MNKKETIEYMNRIISANEVCQLFHEANKKEKKMQNRQQRESALLGMCKSALQQRKKI